MSNNDFINDLMDFNPADLSAFHEEVKSNSNPNLYKTNPANTKSEDGHYYSKLRVIYNPFNVKGGSIVNSVFYVLKDADGKFFVDSKLALGDKNCPLFKAWKKLHFSTDGAKFEISGETYTRKSWGDKMFDKTENKYVLVQVIEDANQPELTGKFMAMRLPKAIHDVLQNKMSPSNGDAPIDLMNYLFGPILKMNVTPGEGKTQEEKNRGIKYTLCEFDTDPCPIMNVDGTPLFSDDEIEAIENYDTAKKKWQKAKTEKDREAKKKVCMELAETIKPLMERAFEYVKNNALDIEKECGYKEWTPELTARTNKWLNNVLNLKDPEVVAINESAAKPAEAPAAEMPATEQVATTDDDDLPF